MNPNLQKKENLHIVFWLLKDFSWMMNYHTLGMTMALPTLLLSIWLTILSRNTRANLFHNLAITCWITGNIIWMIGEFFYNDTTRQYAEPAFILGFIFIGYYYVSEFIKKRTLKAL